MPEKETWSRIIRVTITPKGEGIVVVQNKALNQAVAFPEEMNGAEAFLRAERMHQSIVGYSLQVDDQTWKN